MDAQLGLEPTPEAYVTNLVMVFREVWRVLRDDGVVFLNLGDSYYNCSPVRTTSAGAFEKTWDASTPRRVCRHHDGSGLKMKDLCMIPARVALALQADGWYLRSDIIWCLSGGTWVYARTQKGDMPMVVKDMARLDPATVQLWNGTKWTRLLGMNRTERQGDEMELVLRSGERISCTPTHKFPTDYGVMPASEILVGDVITMTRLPEPESPRDCALDEDAAWFAGLYLAEGSKSDDTIQISGHTKEAARWDRVQQIAKKFGGSATVTANGNNQNIRVYGKFLHAILDEFVSGRVAQDKCFAPRVWQYSNKFVSAMLDGYLSGDGGWDEANQRWRLGFCRNYSLERDLRTACARLGYTITLHTAFVKYKYKDVVKDVPTFRGEIRKVRSGHHNERRMGEVVEIRKARCRHVWDLGVEDAPHLFALASGVLTHNSKPNPMPESVTDRPTRSHEYVFLLTKNARYYYDAAAIAEPATTSNPSNPSYRENGKSAQRNRVSIPGQEPQSMYTDNDPIISGPTRNCRTVWTINPQSFKGSHFATFPEALATRCLLAGTSERGQCPTCSSPWVRVVERKTVREMAPERCAAGRTSLNVSRAGWRDPSRAPSVTTVGWSPSCTCPAHTFVPQVVLDPFAGSGTVGVVCERYGRRFIGIDLNPDYCAMAQQRIADVAMPLLDVAEVPAPDVDITQERLW